MNWSWLAARQASALLGKGHAFRGESGPVPNLGFPLLPTLLVPPQTPALSVCPVICLKESIGCQLSPG